ncbi:MAG TPA: hypothetical protein VKP61_17555 [Candidatus Acidoferrum sp.]|jgi:hypothetical protein|nr:hypothetical protein [Candidatus Acidoferrum sp.]
MKLRILGLQKMLRTAGMLIILGLAAEIFSLWWVHPLSFVLFAFVGVSLIGAGILVYLASLLFAASPPSDQKG